MDKRLETLDYRKLPNWLSAPKPEKLPTISSREALLEKEYSNMFERIIEDIFRGKGLMALINEDHRVISYEGFMKWIKADPDRLERYREAQEMRTELMSTEIINISDGYDADNPYTNEAVNRDKLRIETRKWLIAAHNKRYRDSKQVEIAGAISISEALSLAQSRVIEAEVVELKQSKQLESEE